MHTANAATVSKLACEPVGMALLCILKFIYFSLLRLINAMINSATPAHNHIIPNAVFSAQNQASDRIIHVIAKIQIPLLLIIILHELERFFSLQILICITHYTMPRPIKKRGQIFSLYFRITVLLAAFLHVAL